MVSRFSPITTASFTVCRILCNIYIYLFTVIFTIVPTAINHSTISCFRPITTASIRCFLRFALQGLHLFTLRTATPTIVLTTLNLNIVLCFAYVFFLPTLIFTIIPTVQIRSTISHFSLVTMATITVWRIP